MIDYSDIPIRMAQFIKNEDWNDAHDLRRLISKLYPSCFVDNHGYLISQSDIRNEKHLEAACKLYHDVLESRQNIDSRTSTCWDIDCAICGQTKLGIVHKQSIDWQNLHKTEVDAGNKHHIWCSSKENPCYCWNCYDKYTKFHSGTEGNSVEVMKLPNLDQEVSTTYQEVRSAI